MPTFQYKAKTQAGQLVSGTLAAGDRRLALAEFWAVCVEIGADLASEVEVSQAA